MKPLIIIFSIFSISPLLLYAQEDRGRILAIKEISCERMQQKMNNGTNCPQYRIRYLKNGEIYHIYTEEKPSEELLNANKKKKHNSFFFRRNTD